MDTVGTEPLIPPEAYEPGFTTAMRCALVADLIEENPERHDQGVWCRANGFTTLSADRSLRRILNGEVPADCGTTACVAGWAVLAAPAAEMHLYRDMVEAATAALGLRVSLADVLFSGRNDRGRLVEVLRWAETLSECDRTHDAAVKQFVPGGSAEDFTLWLAAE